MYYVSSDEIYRGKKESATSVACDYLHEVKLLYIRSIMR